MALFRQRCARGFISKMAVLAAGLATIAIASPARAEAPECISPNPSDWPAPSRPYFMMVVDTSGSMIACTTPPTQYPVECNSNAAGYKLNSCGMVPNRLNDAKCALRQTVQAFSGEVNFGLATFASYLSNCTAGACNSQCGAATGASCDWDSYNNCTWNTFVNSNSSQCGNNPSCAAGAGPALPNLAEGSWRNGGNVVVGLDRDAWWLPPPAPSPNTQEILKWFDGQCNESKELFARDSTPIAGSLRSVTQYLRAGWTQWNTSNYCPNNLNYAFKTPLDTNDRPCRSVNVIMLTDGDETCDTQAQAVSAAQDLFQNGATIGGKTWKVPVYVINFAGGTKANTDQIAAAGGTKASYSANDEVTLAKALASIVGGAAKPEVCDNADNNCNGCTDEGYKHYCDVGQACCPWSTAAQRQTCLTNYQATITAANPSGDLTKLPCTTAAQQADPASWLCYNPKDVCDNVDNNCSDGTDEGQTKCGNPLHCPTAETCNGEDDDCDGTIDEAACDCLVTPSAEICDGCDNDCDGMADDGVAPVTCGQANPANCQGTQACKAAQPVPKPGACVAGGGYGTCSNNPQPESCDGIDNDCDGIVDDAVAPVACVPAGTPGGIVFGANSQCKQGTKACGSSACVGFVGPSPEICDGIDNDCDGQVDEGSFGVGVACGINAPPCSPGTTACVNGALVCQGGVGPQSEVCDNKDNDCDGTVDEAPLADGPLAGENGCWNNAGNCCTFKNAQWCPPPGATCTDNGTLQAPCNKGTLVCQAGAWACQGPSGPTPEQCDSTDNDCDGLVDDVSGVGQSCGTDVGECIAGVAQCSPNGIVCVGQVGPATEICDGKDNDCDGQTDEGVAGLGKPCGINQAPCTLGNTACINGAIVCQGGVGPQAEVCDGIDNDCDGKSDEAPLSDAPGAGQNGCWNQPGNCCKFENAEWCPPPGAGCNDNGVLTAPCNKGSLGCQGALGWVCIGPKGPQAEACDGLDNDCNGLPDDGTFPGEGNACGSDTGECAPGVIDCTGGILDCVNDVPPAPETCNGKDDDCNGTVDNGILVGGSCPMPYDTTLYPGPRDKGACQPGTLSCDGMGGEQCTGGIGPSPEACDGIDNDCDGQVDEPGKAPDGVDGSANPLPPPNASIGDACGVDMGACEQGTYVCINGQFACVGGQGATEEACDCQDNDCDGTIDEQDPNKPPVCAPGNSCVNSGGVCGCAAPCQGGEFPCPPGQKCEQVNSSETGMPLGLFCLADNCGNCGEKTVTDANGKVICAPAGTPADASCIVPPVCVCKGQAGCKDPCDGVTCPVGLVCNSYGDNAGKCVKDSCFQIPCQGCDKACNLGACVDNPCKAESCPAGQACKPNGDFTGVTCFGSCADVTCPQGQVCDDGACVPTCDPACAAGETCDMTQSPPVCVASKCAQDICTDGSCCDPMTGFCGNCPCEGVVCPNGQECKQGECVQGQGGSGGAGGAGGGATSSSSGTGGSAGAGGGTAGDTGIWGLPTGGGGCSCDLGGHDRGQGLGWALAALALGILRRRSSARRGAEEGSR
jgi:hypothetical protein